jgi:hypothetical protein
MNRTIRIRSLRSRLLALWLMLAASGVVTGLLLVEFYRQSTNALVGRAEEAVARSCRELADRYQAFAKVAGVIVVKAGYSAAFLTLAAIAGAGLALFWLAMPETWRSGEKSGAREVPPQSARTQAAA